MYYIALCTNCHNPTDHLYTIILDLINVYVKDHHTLGWWCGECVLKEILSAVEVGMEVTFHEDVAEVR